MIPVPDDPKYPEPPRKLDNGLDWSKITAVIITEITAPIRAFAKKQGIAPSIVLGRLQHREKCVSHSYFNSLKHKVEIAWECIKTLPCHFIYA